MYANVFNQCVSPFFNGCLKAKSLRVHLFSDSGAPLTESQVKEWAHSLGAPCTSKDLTVFNVWFYPVDDDQPQNLGGMKEWDAQIFPSLVLNYCGENLLRPLDEGLLHNAIQSINQGTIYHKTTRHKAFDMRMANAGLIYAMLRIKAGKTHGLGAGILGQKATSPPRLCRGTKRQAPSHDSGLGQD
jgi:hypothetical protein